MSDRAWVDVIGDAGEPDAAALAIAHALLERERWLFRSETPWMAACVGERLAVAWGPRYEGALEPLIARIADLGSEALRARAFAVCHEGIAAKVEQATQRKVLGMSHFQAEGGHLCVVAALQPRAGEEAEAGRRSPTVDALQKAHEAVVGKAPAVVSTLLCKRLLAFSLAGVLTREEEAALKVPEGQRSVVAARQHLRRPFATALDTTLADHRAGYEICEFACLPDADLCLGYAVLRSDTLARDLGVPGGRVAVATS